MLSFLFLPWRLGRAIGRVLKERRKGRSVAAYQIAIDSLNSVREKLERGGPAGQGAALSLIMIADELSKEIGEGGVDSEWIRLGHRLCSAGKTDGRSEMKSWFEERIGEIRLR